MLLIGGAVYKRGCNSPARFSPLRAEYIKKEVFKTMFNKTLKDFLQLNNEENMEAFIDFINTGNEEQQKENGYYLLQLLSGKDEASFWLSNTKLLYVSLSDWDECEGAYHIHISFNNLNNMKKSQDFHFLHYEDFDLIKLINDFLF